MKRLISLLGIFLFLGFLIFFSQVDTSNQEVSKKKIVVSEEDLDFLEESDLEKELKTEDGLLEPEIFYETDTTNLLKGRIQVTKRDDKTSKYIKEYLNIIQEAINSKPDVQISIQFILGFISMENFQPKYLNTNFSGVDIPDNLYIPNIGMPISHFEETVNGRQVTLSNWGSNDTYLDKKVSISSLKTITGTGNIAPFGLNASINSNHKHLDWEPSNIGNINGVKDYRNLKDGANQLLNVIEGKWKSIKTAEKLYKVNLTDKQKELYLVQTYSMGEGNLRAFIPPDNGNSPLYHSLKENEMPLVDIMLSENLQKDMKENFQNIYNQRAIIITEALKNGWQMEDKLWNGGPRFKGFKDLCNVGKVDKKYCEIMKSKTDSMVSLPEKYAPADYNGNRNNGGNSKFQFLPGIIYKSDYGLSVYPIDHLVYINTISRGNVIYESMMNYLSGELGQTNKIQSLLGIKHEKTFMDLHSDYVRYFYEDIKEELTKEQKTDVYGRFGESGYKGNFPIFTQMFRPSNLHNNKVSKLPMKFRSSNVTMGQAGCSVFTANTLILGAGYQDIHLKGCAEGKIPTIENLSKVTKECYPAPWTASDLRKMGFTMSKKTSLNIKKDRTSKNSSSLGKEDFFEELLTGIPYAVNVKGNNGDAFIAYDKNGTKITTTVTSIGHFVTFIGAYEENGKRFVEMVDSYNHNANQFKTKRGREITNNNLLKFDYDYISETTLLGKNFGSIPIYTIESFTENGETILPLWKDPNYTPVFAAKLGEQKRPTILKYEPKISKGESVYWEEKVIKIEDDSFKDNEVILKSLNLDPNDFGTKQLTPNINTELNIKENNLVRVSSLNNRDLNNIIIIFNKNDSMLITDVSLYNKENSNKEVILKEKISFGRTTEWTRIKKMKKDDNGKWIEDIDGYTLAKENPTGEP